jgi:hypothetical protein
MLAPGRIPRAAHHLAWNLAGFLWHGALWQEMWRLERSLPGRLQSPLPELVAGLTPEKQDLHLAASTVRHLADAVAGLDIRSPLGICLRRSLLRYHFLRRAGVPAVIHFGARIKGDDSVGGHAWLTLNGQPYFEAAENYKDYAVMFSYPAVLTRQT